VTKAFGRERRFRVQDHHVGPRDRLETAIVEARDPGYDGAIIETEHELGAHLHPAAPPLHDADEVARSLLPQGHEIDEGDASLRHLERRLQDQCVAAITAADAKGGVARSDAPMSVVGASKQRRKDGPGNETRPTQPIDRAGAADERRGLAVADQAVIFDEFCHDPMRRSQRT
jgi:hypothetical protein